MENNENKSSNKKKATQTERQQYREERENDTTQINQNETEVQEEDFTLQNPEFYRQSGNQNYGFADDGPASEIYMNEDHSQVFDMPGDSSSQFQSNLREEEKNGSSIQQHFANRDSLRNIGNQGSKAKKSQPLLDTKTKHILAAGLSLSLVMLSLSTVILALDRRSN